jgi:protein CpxP
VLNNKKLETLKMKQLVAVFFALALMHSLPVFADESKVDSPDAVETRVTELHTKLKITDGQEDIWKNVTKEMRDSAKAMKDLNETREHGAKTMTALDDLKSYGEIAALHADSMKKFLVAFTPLYNAMSDDQKKNADDIFRGHKDAKRMKK